MHLDSSFEELVSSFVFHSFARNFFGQILELLGVGSLLFLLPTSMSFMSGTSISQTCIILASPHSLSSRAKCIVPFILWDWNRECHPYLNTRSDVLQHCSWSIHFIRAGLINVVILSSLLHTEPLLLNLLYTGVVASP